MSKHFQDSQFESHESNERHSITNWDQNFIKVTSARTLFKYMLFLNILHFAYGDRMFDFEEKLKEKLKTHVDSCFQEQNMILRSQALLKHDENISENFLATLKYLREMCLNLGQTKLKMISFYLKNDVVTSPDLDQETINLNILLEIRKIILENKNTTKQVSNIYEVKLSDVQLGDLESINQIQAQYLDKMNQEEYHYEALIHDRKYYPIHHHIFYNESPKLLDCFFNGSHSFFNPISVSLKPSFNRVILHIDHINKITFKSSSSNGACDFIESSMDSQMIEKKFDDYIRSFLHLKKHSTIENVLFVTKKDVSRFNENFSTNIIEFRTPIMYRKSFKAKKKHDSNKNTLESDDNKKESYPICETKKSKKYSNISPNSHDIVDSSEMVLDPKVEDVENAKVIRKIPPLIYTISGHSTKFVKIVFYDFKLENDSRVFEIIPYSDLKKKEFRDEIIYVCDIKKGDENYLYLSFSLSKVSKTDGIPLTPSTNVFQNNLANINNLLETKLKLGLTSDRKVIDSENKLYNNHIAQTASPKKYSVSEKELNVFLENICKLIDQIIEPHNKLFLYNQDCLQKNQINIFHYKNYTSTIQCESYIINNEKEMSKKINEIFKKNTTCKSPEIRNINKQVQCEQSQCEKNQFQQEQYVKNQSDQKKIEKNRCEQSSNLQMEFEFLCYTVEDNYDKIFIQRYSEIFKRDCDYIPIIPIAQYELSLSVIKYDKGLHFKSTDTDINLQRTEISIFAPGKSLKNSFSCFDIFLDIKSNHQKSVLQNRSERKRLNVCDFLSIICKYLGSIFKNKNTELHGFQIFSQYTTTEELTDIQGSSEIKHKGAKTTDSQNIFLPKSTHSSDKNNQTFNNYLKKPVDPLRTYTLYSIVYRICDIYYSDQDHCKKVPTAIENSNLILKKIKKYFKMFEEENIVSEVNFDEIPCQNRIPSINWTLYDIVDFHENMIKPSYTNNICKNAQAVSTENHQKNENHEIKDLSFYGSKNSNNTQETKFYSFADADIDSFQKREKSHKNLLADAILTKSPRNICNIKQIQENNYEIELFKVGFVSNKSFQGVENHCYSKFLQNFQSSNSRILFEKYIWNKIFKLISIERRRNEKININHKKNKSSFNGIYMIFIKLNNNKDFLDILKKCLTQDISEDSFKSSLNSFLVENATENQIKPSITENNQDSNENIVLEDYIMEIIINRLFYHVTEYKKNMNISKIVLQWELFEVERKILIKNQI